MGITNVSATGSAGLSIIAKIKKSIATFMKKMIFSWGLDDSGDQIMAWGWEHVLNTFYNIYVEIILKKLLCPLMHFKPEIRLIKCIHSYWSKEVEKGKCIFPMIKH